MKNFEQLFTKSAGKSFLHDGITYHLSYRINSKNYNSLVLIFESYKNTYRQGVHVESDSEIFINKRKNKKFVLWCDTSPKKVICTLKEGMDIWIWNIWSSGDNVVHSGHAGAAMIVDEISQTKWRFSCNDGQINDDCDDIIFSVELFNI